MRTPTTGETIGMAAAFTFAAALGGCSANGEGTVSASASASASASPEATTEATPGIRPIMRAVGATVINGRDSAGRAVGVRTYIGPENPRAAGIYPEGEHIGVLCVADGRTVTDRDVPAGRNPVVSSKWYLMNTSMEDWMGNGYIKVDNGATVSACPEYVIPAGPVTDVPQENK